MRTPAFSNHERSPGPACGFSGGGAAVAAFGNEYIMAWMSALLAATSFLSSAGSAPRP